MHKNKGLDNTKNTIRQGIQLNIDYKLDLMNAMTDHLNKERFYQRLNSPGLTKLLHEQQ